MPYKVIIHTKSHPWDYFYHWLIEYHRKHSAELQNYVQRHTEACIAYVHTYFGHKLLLLFGSSVSGY